MLPNEGLGVVIMEPLRGGLLVKGLTPKAKEIIEKSPIRKEPAPVGASLGLESSAGQCGSQRDVGNAPCCR
jgi:hypothetical protein